MDNATPTPSDKKEYSPVDMIVTYLKDNPNLSSSFQNFLTNRLSDQIKWYNLKSISFKHRWERNRRVVIILSACIPFGVGLINQFDLKSDYINIDVILQILVGAAGVTIAIMEGFNSLSKSQELYIDYRVTAAKLQQQFSLFIGNTGDYSDPTTAYGKLISNVETIIASENKSWAEISKQNDQKVSTNDIQDFVQAYLEKYGFPPLAKPQDPAPGGDDTVTTPVNPGNGDGGAATPPVNTATTTETTPPVVPPVDPSTPPETPPAPLVEGNDIPTP